jgi:hypothetical protein
MENPIIDKQDFDYLITTFNNRSSISYYEAMLLGSTDLLQRLLKLGALAHQGNLKSIICPNCDDIHEVLIDPVLLKGYCLETGYIAVEPQHLMNYVVSSEWLISFLQDNLSIASHHEVKEVIAQHLWYLGEARVGKHLVPIYLACHEGHDTGFLEKHFSIYPREKAGIILLTFDHEYNGDIDSKHRPIAITQIIADTSNASLSIALLHKLWQGFDMENDNTLTHNPDYSFVNYAGISHTFTGDKQKQIVRHLIKAYKVGSPLVRTANMMQELDFEKTAQLPHIFKRHRTWRQLITYGEPRGYCRIGKF